MGQDAQRNKQEKDTAAHKKTGCNGTASAPVLTRAPLYLDKYNDTHALRHVRYGDGRRRAWVTRGAKTLCPSQTNNNSSTLLPTKIQLSTCSMRPCARTRSAPPQQIQKHEYIHCRAVHMRAGRGGRGATAHSPESKKTKHTTAHQRHGCRRAACAPVPTRTPLYLDKYKQIHTLLRCRYESGGRRAWVTRGATSHSTS